MLVENATSAWGQSWEWVLHKHSCIQFIALVPKKPIPEIVPMMKLDIPVSIEFLETHYRHSSQILDVCNGKQIRLFESYNL